MNPSPDYRRRRIAVAAAGLALMLLAQAERPAIGHLAVRIDSARTATVSATFAPSLLQPLASLISPLLAPLVERATVAVRNLLD